MTATSLSMRLPLKLAGCPVRPGPARKKNCAAM